MITTGCRNSKTLIKMRPCSLSHLTVIIQGDSWLSQVPELHPWIHALVSDPGGVLNTRHSASRTAAFQRIKTVGFPPNLSITSLSYCPQLYTRLPPACRRLRQHSAYVPASLAMAGRAPSTAGRSNASTRLPAPRSPSNWNASTHGNGGQVSGNGGQVFRGSIHSLHPCLPRLQTPLAGFAREFSY